MITLFDEPAASPLLLLPTEGVGDGDRLILRRGVIMMLFDAAAVGSEEERFVLLVPLFALTLMIVVFRFLGVPGLPDCPLAGELL